MSGVALILQEGIPEFLSNKPQDESPRGATTAAQVALQTFAQFPTTPANPLQPYTFRMDNSSPFSPIPIVSRLFQAESSSSSSSSSSNRTNVQDRLANFSAQSAASSSSNNISSNAIESSPSKRKTSSSSSSSQVSASSGNKVSREQYIEKINSIINQCIEFKENCGRRNNIRRDQLESRLTTLSRHFVFIEKSREILGETDYDAEWDGKLIILRDFVKRMKGLLRRNPIPSPKKTSSSSSSSQVSSSSGNELSPESLIEKTINECIKLKKQCDNRNSVERNQLKKLRKKLSKALKSIQQKRKEIGKTVYDAVWDEKLRILDAFLQEVKGLLKRNHSANLVLSNISSSSDTVKPPPQRKRKRTTDQSSSSNSDSISSDAFRPPPPKRKKADSSSSSSSSSSQVSSSSKNELSQEEYIEQLINECFILKNYCNSQNSIERNQLKKLRKKLSVAFESIQQKREEIGQTEHDEVWDEKLRILKEFQKELHSNSVPLSNTSSSSDTVKPPPQRKRKRASVKSSSSSSSDSISSDAFRPPPPKKKKADSSSSSSSSSSQVSSSSGNELSQEELIKEINKSIDGGIKFRNRYYHNRIRISQLEDLKKRLSMLLELFPAKREQVGKTTHDEDWDEKLRILKEFQKELRFNSVPLSNTSSSSDTVEPPPQRKRKHASVQSSSSSSSDSISSDAFRSSYSKREKTGSSSSSSSSSSSQVSSSSGNELSLEELIQNLESSINEWTEYMKSCYKIGIDREQLAQLSKALNAMQHNKRIVGYTRYSTDWNKKLGNLRGFHKELAAAFEQYPDAYSLDLREMSG